MKVIISVIGVLLVATLCVAGMIDNQSRTDNLAIYSGNRLLSASVEIKNGQIVQFNAWKQMVYSSSQGKRYGATQRVFINVSTMTASYPKYNPNNGNLKTGNHTWQDFQDMVFSGWMKAEQP